MGYDRNPRGSNPGDYYDRRDDDYGRDYGAGRDYNRSSARDYEAAGAFEREDRGGANAGGYGGREQGGRGRQEYGYPGYAGDNRGGQVYGQSRGQGGSDDRQSFGRGGYEREQGGRGDYGRQPQGYDYGDRGFIQRAGDEVRSWFGDDDAERRRDLDARYDDRQQQHRDSDYHSWRQGQISQLDRDYDEYRREHRAKFENEFSSWRTGRQGQRELLTKVDEHMDVVGADGAHVGTVDKVRGDRIILTKSDADAGGRHHSIPSAWLKEVGTNVTLAKTADEAKKHWRDEERNGAMFGDDRGQDRQDGGRDAQGRMLGRSFSGTY